MLLSLAPIFVRPMEGFPLGCHAWREHAPLFSQQQFQNQPFLIEPALQLRSCFQAHLDFSA
jgi:hypothetical protein